LGVTINDVFQTLQTYLGSSYVNRFNKFNQSFEVRVQAGAGYRRRLHDNPRLYLPHPSAPIVPLRAVIKGRRWPGAELLTRFNLYPAASIVGSPAPGFSTGQALNAMERIVRESLPAGMGWDWTGISYQEQLVGNQSYLIFLLSITLVFLVLAGLYE